MTDQTPLRDALAAAIRAATCTGECGQTEEECRQQRIQPVVWHHGRLAVVEGTPEQLAAAVLPAPADQAAVLREAAERAEIVMLRLRLKRDHGAATGAYAVVTELRRMADEMQPAQPPALHLTDTERDMLHYALDLAQERMFSRGDEFTDDERAAVDRLLLKADETQPTEAMHQPRRGDAVEQWLKAQRDEWAPEGCQPWWVLDQALDLYRRHADAGTPLSEHMCEEQPAEQQDGARP